MRRSDREARLERARTLGRIAYGRVRFFQQDGLIELEGENKEVLSAKRIWLFRTDGPALEGP